MLETGAYGTIEVIATAERINSSYVSRLPLTLLAPEIVDWPLNGAEAPKLTLATLMNQFLIAWASRRSPLQLDNHGGEDRSRAGLVARRWTPGRFGRR